MLKLFPLLFILIACGSSNDLTLPSKEIKQAKTGDESNTQNQFNITKYDINDIVIYDINEKIKLEENKKLTEQSKQNSNKKTKKITKNGFRIQIAVLSDFSKTKELEAKLSFELKDTEHTVYTEFYSPSYRIRVGDFATKDEAKKALLDLNSLGYTDAFVASDNVILYIEE